MQEADRAGTRLLKGFAPMDDSSLFFFLSFIVIYTALTLLILILNSINIITINIITIDINYFLKSSNNL